MTAVQIPLDKRREFLEGETAMRLPAPASNCHYVGQQISVFVQNPMGLPIVWGKATVNQLSPLQGQWMLDVTIEPLITESLLAPDCLGTCNAVLDTLPSAANETVLFDLRRRASTPFLIPGAAKIGLPTPQSFPWARYPRKDINYVFIPENPKISEAAIFDLFREMKKRGYQKIFWYYPGLSGLLGGVYPPDVPANVRLLRSSDWPTLRQKKAQLLYVGPKSDFRNLKGLPLPLQTAFFRERYVSPKNSGNPFERRSDPKRFEFSLQSLPRRTPIVLIDKDAADVFKYQAAQALLDLGYHDVRVMPGGIAAFQAQANLQNAVEKNVSGSVSSQAKTSAQAEPPSAVESAAQSLCTEDRCSNDQPHVIYLQNSERPRAKTNAVLRIQRPLPKGCLRIGDKVILARFEKSSKNAYWLGRARLISAQAANPQTVQMVLVVEDYSPSESKLLAPYCAACKVIHSAQNLEAQKPFVISINDPSDPSGVTSTNRKTLLMPTPSAATLNNVKLPTDLKRPAVIWLPHPLAQWRSVLDWAQQSAQKTKREFYWLYPQTLTENFVPPRLPGVIEVDPAYLQRLDQQRATLLSFDDLKTGLWSGPIVKMNPLMPLPAKAVGNLTDSNLESMWPALRPHLKEILKLNPTTTQIVISSRTIADYQSYYLARTLWTLGYRQIYWYRSSFESWKTNLAFDPGPQ